MSGPNSQRLCLQTTANNVVLHSRDQFGRVIIALSLCQVETLEFIVGAINWGVIRGGEGVENTGKGRITGAYNKFN